jgi:hypothetical protein
MARTDHAAHSASGFCAGAGSRRRGLGGFEARQCGALCAIHAHPEDPTLDRSRRRRIALGYDRQPDHLLRLSRTIGDCRHSPREAETKPASQTGEPLCPPPRARHLAALSWHVPSSSDRGHAAEPTGRRHQQNADRLRRCRRATGYGAASSSASGP